MKTLREYMDVLDEISRRDFIKGAGAAALGGAASSASAFTPSISFLSGALSAQQQRQRSMEVPELNIIVAPNDNLAPADQLSQQDQETIIKVIQLYILNGLEGGNSNYKTFAWEVLNNLAATWDIRPLLKSRAEQIKKHHENKQNNDPEYYARLKRIYTTNQQIQNQIYDAGKALIEKGRQLAQTKESIEETEELDPITRVDKLFRDQRQ